MSDTKAHLLLGIGAIMGPIFAAGLVYQLMGRHEIWVPEMVELLRTQVVVPLVNRQDETEHAAAGLQGQVAAMALQQAQFSELLLLHELPKQREEYMAILQLIVTRCVRADGPVPFSEDRP